MSTNTTDTATGTVEFIEYHRPGLLNGDYEITVQQNIERTVSWGQSIPAESFKTVRAFTVAGERFSLKPDDVGLVFPPAGSVGDHSNVLPHVVLNRSTMPWERLADPDDESLPWLALLLFDETDKLGGVVDKQAFRDAFETNDAVDVDALWDDLIDKAWLATIDAEKAQILVEASRDTLDASYTDFETQISGIIDQARGPHVVTADTLETPLSGLVTWPGVTLETGQHDDDQVNVIDVEKSLLESILPPPEDLAYLAHVRQSKDDAGNPNEDELAVILGNRLPRAGARSIVHLVSLEERYDYDGGGFVYDDPGAGEFIRLVSLKSWSFTCVDQKQSFKGLLTHLNHTFLFSVEPADLDACVADMDDEDGSIPLDLKNAFTANGYDALTDDAVLSIDEAGKRWRIIDTGIRPYAVVLEEDALHVYRLEYDTLRLPANAEAEHFLAMGYTALPHAMRQADQTVSWYHGPLAPVEYTTEIEVPVPAADALLRYHETYGMFDVSYAAAWEVGRMLALQSTSFSVSLYNWKRANKQNLACAEQAVVHPLYASDGDGVEVPSDVSDWFDRLSRLQGVPFNYLVPDERMLPRESIRFFTVDPAWIDCLLDGAFSIGRVTTSDHEHDCDCADDVAVNPHDLVSGFLLRSDVVAGWPDLLVDGYDGTPAEVLPPEEENPNEQPLSDLNKLDLLRMDRLSDNVLICLFAGAVKTVDIHQKPETMHFGVDKPDGAHDDYYKELRDVDGFETDVEVPDAGDPFLWKDQSRKIIDIKGLALAMKEAINEAAATGEEEFSAFTSAQFALEMIEGVEKVRFINAA